MWNLKKHLFKKDCVYLLDIDRERAWGAAEREHRGRGAEERDLKRTRAERGA